MTDRHRPQPPDHRHYLLSQGHANTYRGDGVLSTEPEPEPASEAASEAASAVDRFDYDPYAPVPTLDGDDQRAIEVREDVLCYTSAPLTRALRVAGPVRLIIFVSSSIPGAGITGKLVDVGPDGDARFVTDGIARIPRAREVHELRIDLGTADAVFASGHRLRLEVSGGSVPKYDEPGELPAVNRVHHGPATPSRLLLPVVES